MQVTRFQGLDSLRVVCSLGIVFLHVYQLGNDPSKIEWLLKLRDFALPVMVMTSFFLLTVCLKNKRLDFNDFFVQKIKRLWLPLMIWSGLYVLAIACITPLIFGGDVFGESLSPKVFVSGYRHLWYLQFLFIGSLISYPFIFWLLGNKKLPGGKALVFCFGLTVAYGFLLYYLLKNHLFYETDVNLDIFISQTGRYIFYIPAAIGLGLSSERISGLFQQNWFRHASLAVVLTAAAIHLLTNQIVFSREFYGIAVFIAALQPWKQLPFPFWQTLARFSFGIYILHFFFVQILWMILDRINTGLNGYGVIIFTLIIYFLSFAAAVLIRKLLPFDFLMPMIELDSKKKSRGNSEFRGLNRKLGWQNLNI